MALKVKIEISNRHIHLSEEDLDSLFGNNYKLKIKRKLSQQNDFAAEETVTISNLLDSEKQIKEIRIVGPARAQTQVEILKSDLSKLGLNEVPLRISGDITDTPGIFIDGPKSGIAIDEGLIIAKRHIHVSPEDAQKHHLTEGSRVSAKVLSSGRIIEHLNVRIKKGFTTVIHIDKDEALKFGVGTNEETEIIN